MMKVDGVKEAKAEFEKNWAWVKYDPEKTTPKKLVEAVNDETPFEAKLPEKPQERSETALSEVIIGSPAPGSGRAKLGSP